MPILEILCGHDANPTRRVDQILEGDVARTAILGRPFCGRRFPGIGHFFTVGVFFFVWFEFDGVYLDALEGLCAAFASMVEEDFV